MISIFSFFSVSIEMFLVWEYCGHSIVKGQKTYIFYLTINKKDDGLANGPGLQEERCNNAMFHTDLQSFHCLGVCA